MADDSIKTIDDILSQAEIGKLDAHWRGDIRRQFKTIGERGWFDKQPPSRQILLEVVGEKNARGDYIQEPSDFLAQGIVAMLAATGGVGKTQALIQLALAIASGTKWLDTFNVVEPGHVAILLAEEDEDEAWRRFYYSAKHLGLDKTHPEAIRNRIWVIPMAGLPARLIDATTGESSRTFEGLQSALAQNDVDWRLLILDPASRLMPEDGEFDSAAATDFVAHLEALTQTSKGKPTVLFSHHTRKGGTGKAGVRGSSALTDGARWVTTMKPYGVLPDGTIDEDGEGRVMLKLHKSNYGKPGFSCRFSFDPRGYLRPLTPTEQKQEQEPPSIPRKMNRKDYNNG